MSAAGSESSQRGNEDSIESGATPLELFFALVFVFALTQVTGFLADHLTWTGMLQGTVRSAVVGMGVLLVADQRRAHRGNHPRATGDPLCDRGYARSFARRTRRLRRVRGALRLSLLRGATLARGALRARHRTNPGDAARRPPVSTWFVGRAGVAHRGWVPRWLGPGALWAVALATLIVSYCEGLVEEDILDVTLEDIFAEEE
jgi:Bacterial low temperature requirement A protein (LtrA)